MDKKITTPQKDKMVKGSPRQKVVKNGDDIEITTEELSPKEEKQIKVVETMLAVANPQVVTGMDLFNKMDRQQIELIKRTVAKGATDDELKMFLNVCVGANLNPFLRQVHFVKRWDGKVGKEVGSIQVGIDGFRAIAESGGQYAGSDDAIFKDEMEVEIKGAKIKAPGQASVTVYKLMGDKRYPFSATARWSEYYPGEKQSFMWSKMPYGQLAKCAEALALRKAFPKLLSGMYEPAEMEQAGGGQTMSDYDKLVLLIKQSTSKEALEKLWEKLQTSDRYDDDQKTKLQTEIENKIKSLENANS